MFTISHHTDNGMEMFYAAKAAVYHGPFSDSPCRQVEIVPDGNEAAIFLTGGRVYVMNESGRTVGTYILGD